MKSPDDTKAERRTVLKGMGVATAAAALAVAAPGIPEAVARESRADQVKARYQETDHVKAFYRTNRY
ncbi:MAG: twin-arginine translocation signal domain-containing protein [Alphaproteobacteria bacterium]|nr:twin-arginine translocation signal domain-containing protein [Alphaproteobacteria bacterium]